MYSTNQEAAQLATRLAFLVAGFGIACWAPLIPFAKQRLSIGDDVLGMLILCIGVGSVTAMVGTAWFSAKFGSKPVIVAGALGLTLTLPLLPIAPSLLTLGMALLVFGASLGSLDVAMNVHAVEVERATGRPMMAGFHALFSIGGVLGATLMTSLLSMQLGTWPSTVVCAVLMLAATLVTWPRLLQTSQPQSGPMFVMPHGVVVVLAALAAVTFLVEGAILDWSALLLVDGGKVGAAHGGIGYMLFSIAMTAGRFGGDAVSSRIGDRATLLWGSLIAIVGFAVLLLAPITAIAVSGFLLIGLGASNLVPVIFRRAGSQRAFPAELAVAAITTTGYAGILLGPAAIGFASKVIGLQMAFWLLAVLMCLVPFCANYVTNDGA